MPRWRRPGQQADAEAERAGGPSLPESGFAPVRLRRRVVEFAVDDPQDTVQRPLLRGEFYERRLLEHQADLVFRGSTVLDVGSNIGNHAVFYALNGAGRVYPFEPNPRANTLLRRTVARNDLGRIDLTHADLGVGAAAGELWVDSPAEHNLGASRLADSGHTRVRVKPLDDLDLEGRVSLLKIDVEGMELDVLAGAARLIEQHRPALGIEVDDENLKAFWAWTEEQRYHVLHAVKMYRRNINYVCVPKG